MTTPLRAELVKLASEVPALREVLLPVLKAAAARQASAFDSKQLENLTRQLDYGMGKVKTKVLKEGVIQFSIQGIGVATLDLNKNLIYGKSLTRGRVKEKFDFSKQMMPGWATYLKIKEMYVQPPKMNLDKFAQAAEKALDNLAQSRMDYGTFERVGPGLDYPRWEFKRREWHLTMGFKSGRSFGYDDYVAPPSSDVEAAAKALGRKFGLTYVGFEGTEKGWGDLIWKFPSR